MIKQRVTTTLIYILLAAFMAVKWTPTHVHLNVQHDHGSGRHQHSVEAHSHQSVAFHADQYDSGHLQVEESMVVDLDHDQSPPNDKKLDKPSAVLAAIGHYVPLIHTREIALQEGQGLLPRLLHQHPGQPRAPPLLS